jgi:hypothetical protein
MFINHAILAYPSAGIAAFGDQRLFIEALAGV